MILEKTVELVAQIYKIHKIIPPKVTQIVIGLGYTGVEVSAYVYEPFIGLASTLQSIIQNTDCTKINFAGKLKDKSLNELLSWSYKAPSLEKIIGIATLNGVSQHILKIINPYTKLKEDILEFLKIEKNTKVTFIGLIKPLIRRINKITQLITLIEDTILTPSEFNQFNCKNSIEQLEYDELSTDILFCTGTTLINNTLEDILEKFRRKAQKIVLIGPTASIIPDILFDYGIDIVGGLKIVDTKSTLQIIQEGGGTKIFKQHGIKYNLIKK